MALFFLIASCEKKKQIYTKKTENTAEIYQWVKKGERLSDSLQDDSAIFCFNKALALCVPKKDYANQYVYILKKKGDIYNRNEDYYTSESIASKALPYLKYTSRPRFSQMIYKLIADNYYGMYDYDNALIYHQKSLETAISQFRKEQLKCDIAFIYLQQKKFSMAINLLEELAKKKTEDKTDSLNTEYQHAFVLYNLGLCYLRTDNPKKALDNLNESLNINLKANDESYVVGNYHALYLYYKKYNNPKLKKFYASKGYYAASKAKYYELNAISEIIEAEEGENLKKYVDLYIKLNDSIMLSKRKAKNQFATSIYDSQKDKEENLELKSRKAETEVQLEKQKNRSFISYIIISTSIVFLVFLVFYITTKGKREKNDIVLESEIRISNKLQEELSKNVFQTFLFAKNNGLENDDNKEKLISDLNDIYIKTRKISKENSKIPTNEKYLSALKEMISEYKTQDVNILLNGFDTISWNAINKNNKIVLFRIVQELFLNMKTHNSASLVSITVKSQHKNLDLVYIDNGSGIKTIIHFLKKVYKI
ncbi:tetratricopeptide (TPR) repeat protein [Flavobacterium nitrogenifigens]|uniref:Tetratricopeptide (TPR) repeat protein n=2 Tax=Flavobacterium TaxID=237 RepID=A0A7W7J1W3_9FLAO|nr:MULTISPECIES: tetratricopeptide repeat protein [Flavobacterium]MBB4804252.1 tetratricopeptide (TPR) repeat protein [Flavobacterium nitrogenifigens]MBB6389352.1 tetratricopeptide (TPR) repeat protein [Flavobacterium notoginsengisoli]